MDVRCERCRAQYVFDDEQVTPAGLTVQCTNCGHLFKVKKKELVVTVPVKPDEVAGTPLPASAAGPKQGGTQAAVPAAAPPAPAAPAPRPTPTHASIPAMPAAAPAAAEGVPPREWRVRQANGNIFTFRELTTLQKWIIEQKVQRDDEISLSGDQWKRLGNIAELASFFQVVEAAERSKTGQFALQGGPQPGAGAMPALTPLPMPVYGVAVQTPGLYPPPPPSGYPPPAYAAPPAPQPGYAPPPSATGAYPQPAGAHAAPPVPDHRLHESGSVAAPAVDVDLGMDEPPRRRTGARAGLVAALLVAVAGGGAYLALPLLRPPPPPPPKPEPAPVTATVPPPAPPVEPPPPPPEPVPAPEPVVQEGVPAAPEPIARPTKVAPAAPKGPKALLARAKALLEKGNADAALELYGRVASDDPENVEALTGRGLCYLDLENWAPAEASFQAALRLEPDDADALLGLAETYRFEGKKAEAIGLYERYLARYPGGDEAEVAKNALAELRK